MKRDKHPYPWTKRELKFLCANIEHLTTQEIADEFGRTYGSVRDKIFKLNIRRSKTARRNHAKNTFTKGMIPWNKNVKGYHASPSTEFKKGHKPKNTKYDGCIVIRSHSPTGYQYKYIRVSESKWELYHRWKWQKHRGPIPSDHIVGFKNGDTLDCNMRNLYLMSMADNARRNTNVKKASASLRKSWADGKWYKSDKYIAFTLATKDEHLRKAAMNSPQLLESQRLRLQLRRAIKNEKSRQAPASRKHGGRRI